MFRPFHTLPTHHHKSSPFQALCFSLTNFLASLFPNCNHQIKSAMKVAEKPEKENEEEGTRLEVKPTQNLLHSLIDSIPNIQSFKGKWSIVRTKLTDLQNHLSDLSDFPTSPLSLDLLHSISAVLSDALSLSIACHSPNPPNGKLKTQNDLDSIFTRLDGLIKDLEVLIKSGVLHEPNISSGSSSTSKRESIRVETRNLITRLQIGTAEAKNSVLDSLLSLLQDDDKNVLIAVAQGVVPVLVRLLDSSSSAEIKEKTVTAIAKISTVDSSKHVLIAEGLVLLNNLLRVVESGSVSAKEKSCIALEALSHSKENARAIGSRGGISSLLEICQAGTPNSQAAAAGVLRNLAKVSEIRENFIEESGFSILLGLLASGTNGARENAIGCLGNLVSGDEDSKLLIAREGGINSLKNFWDSAPAVRSLEVAIALLRNLASNPLIAETLVSDGFLPRVVGVLNCGVLGVRIAAARAVFDLGFNTKTRKQFGEIGCISALVRMLDGKAVEEKEAAVTALSQLMVYAGNRRIFRKEERGIVSTVQLLDPLIQNLNKKYPVSILASLVHSKKSRKQIVASGACVHLQKLVDMDVNGAKKLLESLGRGKLWGVFARP